MIRLIHAQPLANLYNHLIAYPTPVVTLLASFGSLAGFSFIIQLITGILLASHYIGHIDYAFFSIEVVMRDVPDGWLFRYIHANGASMFFILLYLHIFKNLLEAEADWLLYISGFLIYYISVVIAFLGYILPWGQMSYWGATVIINLLTTVPFIGSELIEWLCGGYEINNATLTRFFSLHYCLPFFLFGLILLHLILLHLDGSTDEEDCEIEQVSFYPNYYLKDLFIIFLFFIFYCFFIFLFPNYFGHPDNYILALTDETPEHLIPEWYFLPFYGILRVIPDKFGGAICLLLFIVIYIGRDVSISYSGEIITDNFGDEIYFCFRDLFGEYGLNEEFLDICNWIFISWLGAQEVEEPFVDFGALVLLTDFLYIYLPIFSIKIK